MKVKIIKRARGRPSMGRKCPECGELVVGKKNMFEHLVNEHHPELKKVKTPLIHECPICKEIMPTKEKLR